MVKYPTQKKKNFKAIARVASLTPWRQATTVTAKTTTEHSWFCFGSSPWLAMAVTALKSEENNLRFIPQQQNRP